jgi:hypothetical protein
VRVGNKGFSHEWEMGVQLSINVVLLEIWRLLVGGISLWIGNVDEVGMYICATGKSQTSCGALVAHAYVVRVVMLLCSY